MGVGEGWELEPEHRPWSDFHWWKVPTKGILVLALFGGPPVYYTGHFADGRMWPCVDEGCGMCQRGIGEQVRYVMGAAEVSTHRVGILEVGRANGMLIRDRVRSQGHAEGVVMELSKHSHARTSQTEIRFVEVPVFPWIHQVEAPDLKRALLLTWQRANMPVPKSMLR